MKYGFSDSLGGFEIQKNPKNNSGLGIIPVVVGAVSSVASKVSIIKKAVSAVKSIFSKKTRTHQAGSQRKYGGYMQEWQEGGWWYVPQWERELYSRQIILELANRGYAATAAEVNSFFFYKYDAQIEGKKSQFTGPQIIWGAGPLSATVNMIVADFLKTLPKGSTLSEAELELKIAEDSEKNSAAQVAAQQAAQEKAVADAKAKEIELANAQTAASALLEKQTVKLQPDNNGVPITASIKQSPASPASPLMAGMLTSENIKKVAMIAVPLIVVGMLFGHTSRPAPTATNPHRRRR